MIDASDKATGLPPLKQAGQHDDDQCLLVVRGAPGGEGIVKVPGTEDTLDVRYLHLRALLYSEDDEVEEPVWTQTCIAIPADLKEGIVAALR